MKNKIIICKFGGSSVKNEGIYANIKQIVEDDQNRRIIVVSAPGKAQKQDEKVTDLLIFAFLEPERFDFWMGKVQKVFEDLVFRLKVDFDVKKEIKRIKIHFKIFKNKSYLFSRGENLSAKIFAKYLNAKFVDSASLIKFFPSGKINPRTFDKIKKVIKKSDRIVVPGFYGSTRFGKIKVMSRGGSDITGAIFARSIAGAVYENWTDVDGFFESETSRKVFAKMNFEDMKFLSFFGSSVVHWKCASICEDSKIILKNTLNHDGAGTIICKNGDSINFACAVRHCEEFCLQDTKKIHKLIKKLKADILFKHSVMGKLFVGVAFSKGYSSSFHEMQLRKIAFFVKNVTVNAYILQKNNKIHEIKEKHAGAHIVLNESQKWLFVEERV